MYEDIGQKIKFLAKLFAAAGASLSVIAGLIFITAGMLWGVVVLLLGPVFSYVSSWILYGFGVLVESQEKSAKDIQIVSLNTIDIARRMANVIQEKQETELGNHKNREE